MQIGVVSPWRVDDPRAWSGVVKPMVRELDRLGKVVPLPVSVGDSMVDRALTRLLDGFMGKRYLVGHSLATAKKRSLVIEEYLRAHPVDVLFSIAGSQEIAFLRTSTPIVQVSDATFCALRDFYPLFSNLNPLTSIQGNMQARLSSRRVAHTLAATDWAKQTIIGHDNVPSELITVAPFGPALQPGSLMDPRSRENSSRLSILMVSSDWERKGGRDVLEVGHELNRRRIDFSLTVVGSAPPHLPKWVRPVGRVDTESMKGYYRSADVLLEMSRSNAAGVVLTDAAAFGLPAVAASTGGVSTIVAHGESGFLVAPGDAEGAANSLESLLDPKTYASVSAQALARSEAYLSWGAWREAAKLVIEDQISR